MLGRLFGRTKDDRDDTVCSTCGRTLLAGEWTQRVVDNDGTERFICALCARAGASSGAPLEPVDDVATVSAGRVKPARADSDAFWRALKDKDTEIARLESLLARAEAENQELAAQLAESRGSVAPVVPLASVSPVPAAAPVAHDDVGARDRRVLGRRPRSRRRRRRARAAGRGRRGRGHAPGRRRARRGRDPPPRAHRPAAGRSAARRGARRGRPRERPPTSRRRHGRAALGAAPFDDGGARAAPRPAARRSTTSARRSAAGRRGPPSSPNPTSSCRSPSCSAASTC